MSVTAMRSILAQTGQNGTPRLLTKNASRLGDGVTIKIVKEFTPPTTPPLALGVERAR